MPPVEPKWKFWKDPEFYMAALIVILFLTCLYLYGLEYLVYGI